VYCRSKPKWLPHHRVCLQVGFSTVSRLPKVNRGSTFALKRSTRSKRNGQIWFQIRLRIEFCVCLQRGFRFRDQERGE